MEIIKSRFDIIRCEQGIVANDSTRPRWLQNSVYDLDCPPTHESAGVLGSIGFRTEPVIRYSQ